MKKIVAMTAGVALTVALTAAPAAAHHPEPYSFITCAWTRQNTDHVVDHAHIELLNSSALVAFCETHDVDTRCKYEAVMWKGGLITGPYPAHGNCRDFPAS